MPLQVGSVPFIGRQGIQYEIGVFGIHPFGQQRANIPDLGYPGDGDVQFKGNREEMIQMAIGMVEYGLVTIFHMGGIQHKVGLARCRQGDGITGSHGGRGMFIDN